jgi:hypothetical protein
MRTASLVVIRVGSGSGLQWECSQAFDTVRSERLILLVLDLSMKECRDFSKQVRDTLQVQLPDIPPCDLLRTGIDFRQNWTKATRNHVRIRGTILSTVARSFLEAHL